MKRTIIFLLVSIFMISIAMESQATRKRPGRTKYSNITLKAQQFNDVNTAMNNYEAWLNVAARTGRNPQTGKEIQIAAKTLVTEFDEAMNATEAIAKIVSGVKDRNVQTLLKQFLTAASYVEEDFRKFYDKGNSAAGTRVRKGMQELKHLAQDIRKEVQDKKNND